MIIELIRVVLFLCFIQCGDGINESSIRSFGEELHPPPTEYSVVVEVIYNEKLKRWEYKRGVK